MRIHILQHVPFEGPAHIQQWADDHQHTVTTCRLFAGDPFPEVDEFDRLIVLGGPMNIYEYEEYPWLRQEKLFIHQVITAGTTVVGICLGAQLIADVLGARVYEGKEKEIGWLPLELSPEAQQHPLFSIWPSTPTVFHWHGDTFSLPPEALSIGHSVACAQQGFLYKERVLALQFHIESTPQSVSLLTEHCAHELVAGPYIQSPTAMCKGAEVHSKQVNRLLDNLLDNLP